MRISNGNKILKTGTERCQKASERRYKACQESHRGINRNSPPKGDIKIMQGYSDGRKRLRVGKFRVIYQYLNDGNIYVWVIEIGSRGDIYK